MEQMLPTYSTLPSLLQHALGEHDRESGNEEARVLYLYTSHNRTAYHAGGGRRVCRSAPPEWPPRDRMRRQPFTRVLRVGAADSNIGCMRWFSLPKATRMFPLSNAYRLWDMGAEDSVREMSRSQWLCMSAAEYSEACVTVHAWLASDFSRRLDTSRRA